MSAALNRVMRLKNNPKARGFIVSVLEETGRIPELDIINFRVVEAVECGTKAKANKVWDQLRAKHSAR